MSTKPPNTGNLFKKPFPLADNAKSTEPRQNEEDNGKASLNISQGQRQELVNHETIQPPSIPTSAPLPNLTNEPAHSLGGMSGLKTPRMPNIPVSPNSPPRSGSLRITGGLNGGTAGLPDRTEGFTNELGMGPASFQANTFNTSGMGYGAVATMAQAPQPPVPTPVNTNITPRPKSLIQQARARYNSLPQRSKTLLIILAIAMLFPTAIVIWEMVNTVTIYSQAKSGMQHITNVKNLFSGPGGHASNILDINKLNQAQSELEAAHSDFLQLSNNLDQDGVISLAAGPFPQQIQTLRSLSHIGVDATDIGIHLMGTAKTLAPAFRTPIMPSSSPQDANTPGANTQNSTPLITQSTMDLIKADIDYLLPKLDDMLQYTHNLDLGILPVSDQQKQQLSTLLQVLPQVRSGLAQVEPLLGAIGWIIGVDQPRTFLIQTMDRAELRPGGGFTGQFGMLNLNGGRLAPFSLQNIAPFEEHNPTAVTNGNTPPDPFNWWPVPNFGLRDSNISADFPTSAQIAMSLTKLEFQQNVDGVIVFSPFLISDVLEITGPISVPRYNETITAQNLEQRLHYYQLDNNGIFKEEQVENVQDPDQARKLFTKALGNILMQHVFKAPPDELLGLGQEALYAMQTKDLQIYVTNNDVEQLLAKYGSTAQIDTSPDHDGLMVVQANLSVSKAAQFVQTSIQDTVTLDANGGATHVMNMRLSYAMQGPIYGWDYYRDYVRIYVPPNSQLLSGNGFSAGNRPFCGSQAGYAPCQTDVYGDGTLICPPNVDAGDGVALVGSSLGNQAVSQVGPPLNTNSDMPGRAMFGGWVNIPKNCTMNVALSWYVPPQGNNPYSLMVQRQSSTFPNLDLTIVPTPGDCTKLQTAGMHFSGVLSGKDMLFTLPKTQGGSSTNATCYPESKV